MEQVASESNAPLFSPGGNVQWGLSTFDDNCYWQLGTKKGLDAPLFPYNKTLRQWQTVGARGGKCAGLHGWVFHTCKFQSKLALCRVGQCDVCEWLRFACEMSQGARQAQHCGRPVVQGRQQARLHSARGLAGTQAPRFQASGHVYSWAAPCGAVMLARPFARVHRHRHRHRTGRSGQYKPAFYGNPVGLGLK